MEIILNKDNLDQHIAFRDQEPKKPDKIKLIDSDCFAKFDSDRLDLSYNRLSFINQSHFYSLVEGVARKLVHLDLSNNKIVDLVVAFRNLSGLKLLDLSGNQLEYADEGLFFWFEEPATPQPEPQPNQTTTIESCQHS